MVRKKIDSIIPEGIHCVHIIRAYRETGEDGCDTIYMELEVCGYSQHLHHSIPLRLDRPDVTARMLRDVFDSFPYIKSHDINPEHWIGRVGACRVAHEEHDGRHQAVVKYFIPADEKISIPM